MKKIKHLIAKIVTAFRQVGEDERHSHAFRFLLGAELRKMTDDECFLYARLSGIQLRYIGPLAHALRARSGRGEETPEKIIILIMRDLGYGIGRKA